MHDYLLLTLQHYCSRVTSFICSLLQRPWPSVQLTGTIAGTKSCTPMLPWNVRGIAKMHDSPRSPSKYLIYIVGPAFAVCKFQPNSPLRVGWCRTSQLQKYLQSCMQLLPSGRRDYPSGHTIQCDYATTNIQYVLEHLPRYGHDAIRIWWHYTIYSKRIHNVYLNSSKHDDRIPTA